eukprot:13293295-Alexandrium_andersonii.AAC.1
MRPAPPRKYPRSSASSRPLRRRRPRLVGPRSASAFGGRPASRRRVQNIWANVKFTEFQKSWFGSYGELRK